MTHTPEVVETKQINNEHVAYRIVCCNDPHESTWHTISVLIADHETELEARKAEITARHEAMVVWRRKYLGSK